MNTAEILDFSGCNVNIISIHYIIKRKGKQMRPMLIFLCSKLLNSGKVNDKVYRGASVIELIHTATLIHDDVVDESNKRRGFFSINAMQWLLACLMW